MQPIRSAHRTLLRPTTRLYAALLLALFLAVRGLVPAGFMPAPMDSGSPYGLCHGDARSAFLLQSLAAASNPAGEHHHHGHQQHHGDHGAAVTTPHSGHDHDPATAQAFADNHCSFAASAALAIAAPQLNPIGSEQSGLADNLALNSFLPSFIYLRPQGRAPPFSQPS
ncbi:hypothetical protein AUP74_00700 [Microbulbifer aggregans]|uniref:DUF2946 domain-containing protein n=1 Tax=Microbulbifer aggregans TaxID=1769779 RepID=A0A1C9W4U1_9GAMM|nr:hypothetical protein [Microbulbifer aggregans]AOS96169.1 hypothetical protein AUP74_00700 [Microbulbifer aggregans]